MEWIPVEERLPDKGGDYLASWCVEVSVLGYEKEEGEERGHWYFPNSGLPNRFVTHWMPLPEPVRPKEST